MNRSVPDHQLSTRLQRFEELSEELLLVGDVEDGVPAVDHVVEVVGILHAERVLDVELNPVLDCGLHLCSVVLGDANHVGGEINTMNINSIVPRHVESWPPGATPDVQHLHAWLQVEQVDEVLGGGLSSNTDIGPAKDSLVPQDTLPSTIDNGKLDKERFWRLTKIKSW